MFPIVPGGSRYWETCLICRLLLPLSAFPSFLPTPPHPTPLPPSLTLTSSSRDFITKFKFGGMNHPFLLFYISFVWSPADPAIFSYCIFPGFLAMLIACHRTTTPMHYRFVSLCRARLPVKMLPAPGQRSIFTATLTRYVRSRAPCFCPTFFVQSISSNPIRLD